MGEEKGGEMRGGKVVEVRGNEYVGSRRNKERKHEGRKNRVKYGK